MKKQFRSFEDAKKFAQTLGLKSGTQWQEYCKSGNKPDDIPSYPNEHYKNKGWIGMGNFLGTGNLSPSDKRKQMKSFEECRTFVHSTGVKTEPEWQKWCNTHKKPSDIPFSPERMYKKEWTTMGDWFGTGRVADKYKKWKSFEDAKKIVNTLGFKNREEYKIAFNSKKLPNDIPSTPERTYKNKGWISWGDFVGTGKVANTLISKNYLSFVDAKKESRKLAKKYNLKTFDDWKKAVHEGKIPKNLPLKPNRVYSKKRKK